MFCLFWQNVAFCDSPILWGRKGDSRPQQCRWFLWDLFFIHTWRTLIIRKYNKQQLLLTSYILHLTFVHFLILPIWWTLTKTTFLTTFYIQKGFYEKNPPTKSCWYWKQGLQSKKKAVAWQKKYKNVVGIYQRDSW